MIWRTQTPWLAIIWLAAMFALAVVGPTLLSDPTAINLSERLASPSFANPMGTDELGRSMLSRLAYATRYSLALIAIATSASVLLGLSLGVIAAWFGGFIDRIVNLSIDMLWSIPVAILAVLVIAIIGVTFLSLTLAIIAVSWVSSARISRAESLRILASEHILFARALGAPVRTILLWQLLPNLMPVVLMLIGLSAVEILALESGLSFLGLGRPPPNPTLGGMINSGLSYVAAAWWLVLPPALLLTLTVASIKTWTDRLSGTYRVG